LFRKTVLAFKHYSTGIDKPESYLTWAYSTVQQNSLAGNREMILYAPYQKQRPAVNSK